MERSRTSFLVKHGRRVRFWKDRWCKDIPLCKSFPFLYAFVDSSACWVAGMLETLGAEEVESFLERFYGMKVCGDVVLWAEARNDWFAIKSLCRTLEDSECSAFPSKGIWEVLMQTKIPFFTWRHYGVKF